MWVDPEIRSLKLFICASTSKCPLQVVPYNGLPQSVISKSTIWTLFFSLLFSRRRHFHNYNGLITCNVGMIPFIERVSGDDTGECNARVDSRTTKQRSCISPSPCRSLWAQIYCTGLRSQGFQDFGVRSHVAEDFKIVGSHARLERPCATRRSRKTYLVLRGSRFFTAQVKEEERHHYKVLI